jgi:N-carbamoyl-L-amino-acid hydrolase
MTAKINASRLWKTIMETGRIGATERGGVCRLALSDEDRCVRDWFVEACRSQGCDVMIDDMGNVFARRRGRRADLPPIAIGSHLDTQPTGGRFDGILGVLAGLEVLRSLDEHGIETERPVEVIDWTNEEGARFAPAMLGSGVFVGALEKSLVLAREDRDGRLGLPRFRRHSAYTVSPGPSCSLLPSLMNGGPGAEPPCSPFFSSNSIGLW